MGVLKENSSNPLRDGKEKHVVAEGGGPIRDGKADAFARDHSAAADQEKRRGCCQPNEAIQRCAVSGGWRRHHKASILAQAPQRASGSTCRTSHAKARPV